MGEVFLARDTRLGREVALKVLPRELAANPARRARFEREARTISALSHPHVCALFDVGAVETADGSIEYLVMERLEGETLAARLVRGPLPVPDVLVLGAQLAGALGAAHRRGIVHRDLKPGNVMLTRSGAKLLDFGLARQDDEAPDAAPRETPTSTLATADAPLTRVGTIVGTWPYLAPEQLRGHPADARSDIFALGCVLYEALCGRRAFPGTTPAEVTAAILGSERPDLYAQGPAVPAALAAVAHQCLAPDPDARWQCADDVARALHVVEESLARPGAPRTAPRSRWALAAGGTALVAATAAGFLLAGRAPAPAPLRFSVVPPPGVIVPRPGSSTALAVSPDGRHIVCLGTAGGVAGLYVWSAEDGVVRTLDDTVGAVGPFFSPDGREVAYFAGGDLRRMPIAGGPATTIAKEARGSSGTWGSDGTILFMRPFGPDAGIYSIPAAGGELHAVMRTEAPSSRWAFPRSLPGSRRFLLLGGFDGPAAERRLCVASLDGAEPDCFTSCQSQIEYSGSGHVLCVRSGTLVAIPFDARRARPTGEPITAVRDVRWFGPSGSASYAVSADGSTLVYEPRPAPSRLAWLDRSGRDTGSLGDPSTFGSLQIAPDGRRVAVDLWHPDGHGRDIWSLDAASGVATRLTFARVDAWGPVWAPDGARLAFTKSAGGGPGDLTVLHLDASAQEDWLVRAPGIQVPRHWSPDGRLVTYDDFATGGQGSRQAWLITLDGKARRVTSAPVNSYHGRFSPNGRKLAYVSEESGRPEVYLADLAGTRAPRRISRAGGVLPRFRGDGGELYYFQPDGMMMAVEPADETAAPRSLFHIEGVTASDFDFDVTRDGQRFLMRYSREAEGAAGLRVAREWSRALGAAAAESR